ncbi:hypothetical protein FHS90_004356 [Rufibacter quisquiliarum]|uniref:Uncharacterized protein n=1 Tax=Rufibacter quisquiliarum TaxID=1549639 RepID=A0A839GYU5_9BACT|nr:hypothetical protein [Rufibacter quisquiliarum]
MIRSAMRGTHPYPSEEGNYRERVQVYVIRSYTCNVCPPVSTSPSPPSKGEYQICVGDKAVPGLYHSPKRLNQSNRQAAMINLPFCSG